MNTDTDEELCFVAGQDDPNDFVRAVRRATANKKGSTALGLVGELIKRMEDPAEADVLLQWQEDREIPGGGNYLVTRKATPLVPAVQPDPNTGEPGRPAVLAQPHREAITLSAVQTLFAGTFPMTGAQDKGYAKLEKLTQTTNLKKHFIKYNLFLVKTGKIADARPATLRTITDKAEFKRMIKTVCNELAEELLEEHGDIATPRTHGLKQIARAANLHELQESLIQYDEETLTPLAMDSDIKDEAYWITKAARRGRGKGKSGEASKKTQGRKRARRSKTLTVTHRKKST